MPVLYIVEAYFFSVVLAVLMLALIARVLSRQRRPGASVAWILAILLVPYLGIPAYILFGGRKIQKLRGEKYTLHRRSLDPRVRLLEFDHPAEDVLTSAGVRPPSARNRVEFVADGVAAFDRLMQGIESAERSIYVQTYVLHNDSVGRALLDALAAKAAAGLDVRLLIDSYGSMLTPRSMLRRLKDCGGRVAWFMPLIPVRRHWSLNLRNHRKIVLLDNRRASIGGMNLGLPYLGPEPDPKRWIDTAVLIEGPAVSDVMEVFISDWNFASRDALDLEKTRPAFTQESEGDDIVQIVAAGPDVEADPLYEGVLASVHAARERIWMVTPYFAPGDEIFRALLIQARIGRDVRLLMPARSNHPSADLVRGPYLRELAAAGGKVLLYDSPMIHAKNMVFDARTAVTGTMNIDLRSLYFNFEVAMFAYNGARVREIAAWMEHHMANARPFEAGRPSRLRLLIEQVSFLASPLV